MPERRIAIVVFPGCQALDLTGPHDVFAGANQVLQGRRRDDPRYQQLVAALQPGPVRSESGLAVVPDHALPVLRQGLQPRGREKRVLRSRRGERRCVVASVEVVDQVVGVLRNQ